MMFPTPRAAADSGTVKAATGQRRMQKALGQAEHTDRFICMQRGRADEDHDDDDDAVFFVYPTNNGN